MTEIKTYDEMNGKICGLLRFNGDNVSLYAVQRIKELESENERLRKQLSDGKCVYLSDSETAEGCVQSPYPNYKTVEDILKENAELHARLEKAVELKAKIGEKIYFPWIWDGDSNVGRMTIIDIRINSEGEPIYWTDLEDEIIGYWAKYKCGKYNNSDFGEIVFTEKDYDKAELKLEELRGYYL